MNFQTSAEAEKERRTRSKLEPHREAIFTLRRKHWTYGEIARWLNQHGIATTLSSVHRFCERAISRRPRNADPLQAVESQPPSLPQQTRKLQKHRFNLDILKTSSIA